MSESDVYSDPNRLLSLASDLRGFVTRLTGELEGIGMDLHRLGGTWQDDEYRKFVAVHGRLEQEFRALGEEIQRREPELTEDAHLLRAYLAKST